jgi:hypothetical protein
MQDGMRIFDNRKGDNMGEVTISKLKAIYACYSDEKLEELVNGGISVDKALELDIPAKDSLRFC